jgi:hypothetical protein
VRPPLKKTLHKNRAGGVAKGVGRDQDLVPQKKENKKKKKRASCAQTDQARALDFYDISTPTITCESMRGLTHS